MMIGIDTYTWAKLIRFLDTDWSYIIEDMLDHLNIFITTEGRKEFKYRFPRHTTLLDRIIILPLLHSDKYQSYLQDFDSTDASLLEYSSLKSYRILTEDGPLLEKGVTSQSDIVQLVDFFVELYLGHNFLTKNETINLIRDLRKWKNIRKKKAKYYRNLVQEE